MHNSEHIRQIIEEVERPRVERETMRRLGVDASPHAERERFARIASWTAIVVLGICSALSALALNFILVVWVFHLSFE
jgi:hypothetical protein